MADATPAPAPAATVIPVPVKVRLHPKNFGAAEFKFRRWSLLLEEGQTLDDALDPSAWTNIAGNIMGHDKADPKGRGDIVEIRKLDTGLYAEVLITEIGPGYVKARPIARSEGRAVTIADGAPYVIRWNEGKKKHDVLRRSDKAVMKEGFQSKDAAAAWIAEQVSATKAA